MNVKRSIQSIFLPMPLIVAAVYGGSSMAQPPGQSITSKRANGMTVMLTNESGRLHEGKNNICVSFKALKGGQTVDVRNVAIEFTLRIGRNSSPIKAVLIQDADRYCGSVDLGRQFYFPANYDVSLRYVDSFGKKKRISFGLSLR